jgi:hypothetical protein
LFPFPITIAVQIGKREDWREIMTFPMRSTIAQLLYPNEQAVDFARTVVELETVLTRLRGDALEVEWDCDDVVCFDTSETRILLSRARYGRGGQEACLTVAVGPLHPHPGPASDELVNHQALCSRMVERIQRRNPPNAILWREVEGRVDADVSDEFVDMLPQASAALPTVDSILDHVTRTDLFKTAPLDRAEAKPAQRNRILVARRNLQGRGYPREEIQGRLRRTFARPQPAPRPVYSTPMRLTAHCLNAALIVVYPPMGAAVMAYSLVKGEDLRLSSRLVAVVGTVLSLAQTPFGHSVAAMAGTMVRMAQLPLGDAVLTIVGV